MGYAPPNLIATVAEQGIDETVSMLDREQAVDFATPVYRHAAASPDVVIPTRYMLVQFKPEATLEEIEAINAEHSVEIVEVLDYVANGYRLAAPAGSGQNGAIALANAYYESGLTLFAHPDFIQKREIKSPPGALNGFAIPSAATEETTERSQESFLDEQWHLKLSRVTDAWKTTMGEPAIKVAIFDDGVDIGHPEFNSEGKVTGTFDFARNTDDITLGPNDNHGTACAGVAVASGKKASGGAPRCSLIVARTPHFLGSADEAKMFMWAADNDADIISCSWGPPDEVGTRVPLPDNVRAAINECVRPGGRGRNGKGIAIFWAAGNGREPVSIDGYAANPDVIAVAASTSNETHAWYSDFGDEISICAPSSGDAAAGEMGILCTDRLGVAGYNSGSGALGDQMGDYTNDFGGTSAAAPLAAGIAALVLSVNPNLTAKEIKNLLQRTADKIGKPSDYVNGFSRFYGYGRVNAERAVQEALQLRQLAPVGDIAAPTSEAKYFEIVNTAGSTVPSNRTGGGSDLPSIVGPLAHNRSAEPPTFTVMPGSHRFWGVEVEVATGPGLLNTGRELVTHNTDTFYASYFGGLNKPANPTTFTLPDEIWLQFRAAPRLYYRLVTFPTEDLNWSQCIASIATDDAKQVESVELRSPVRPG
jgi:subtilisin family serine protease